MCDNPFQRNYCSWPPWAHSSHSLHFAPMSAPVGKAAVAVGGPKVRRPDWTAARPLPIENATNRIDWTAWLKRAVLSTRLLRSTIASRPDSRASLSARRRIGRRRLKEAQDERAIPKCITCSASILAAASQGKAHPPGPTSQAPEPQIWRHHSTTRENVWMAGAHSEGGDLTAENERRIS